MRQREITQTKREGLTCGDTMVVARGGGGAKGYRHAVVGGERDNRER